MTPESGHISFRRANMSDIPLFHRWLHAPHVFAWWSDDAGTLEEVTAKSAPVIRGEEATLAFVILAGAEPIGYIQAYRIDEEPEYAAALAVDIGAVGVDLYIGDERFVYRGWGPVILRQFLRQIVFGELNATVCVIGPAASNRSAIRAYEKAGFRWLKTVDVPGECEPEYIMRLTRDELDLMGKVGGSGIA